MLPEGRIITPRGDSEAADHRYDPVLAMTIHLGSRPLKTPSGAEWRVGRRWTPRGLPRWRRVDVGRGAEWVAERTPSNVDIFGVPSFEDLGALAVLAVAVVIVAVVVVPLVLFGVELMIVGLVVAGGIVARAALGRPWIVVATPSANPADALAWEVKGWRRSGQLIAEVETELATGVAPSPARGGDQAMPGLS
jgi:hypothetical protein